MIPIPMILMIMAPDVLLLLYCYIIVQESSSQFVSVTNCKIQKKTELINKSSL